MRCRNISRTFRYTLVLLATVAAIAALAEDVAARCPNCRKDVSAQEYHNFCQECGAKLAGELLVGSTPAGATVIIDGELVVGKVTPCRAEELSWAEHEVKLTLAGYQNWVDKMVAVAGHTNRVRPTLTPIPRSGLLKVLSAARYRSGSRWRNSWPDTTLY